MKNAITEQSQQLEAQGLSVVDSAVVGVNV